MKSKNEIKNKVILKEHHVKNLKHGYEFSDAFYKIVSDNIPISIITIDKEGYITSVNKYFRTFSSIKDYHNHNIFTDPFFIKENLVDEYKKLLKFGTPFRRDNCHEVNSDGEDKYLNWLKTVFLFLKDSLNILNLYHKLLDPVFRFDN